MQMPADLPAVLRFAHQPLFNHAESSSGATAQGLFDWLPSLPIPLPGIGTGVKCAACCRGKAGFLACVARCVATGQACDGGVDNCSPC